MRLRGLTSLLAALPLANLAWAADLTPGAVLRAVYLGANPAQATRDPATGHLRGPPTNSQPNRRAGTAWPWSSVPSMSAVPALTSSMTDGGSFIGANRQRLTTLMRAPPGTRLLSDDMFNVQQNVVVPKGRPAALSVVDAMIDNLRQSGQFQAAINRGGAIGVAVAPKGARAGCPLVRRYWLRRPDCQDLVVVCWSLLDMAFSQSKCVK